MNNESQLQRKADSVVQNMQGKYGVQYRFDAPDALRHYAPAKAVASMPGQSMPTENLSRDLVGNVPTPNYGRRSRTRNIPPALSKRQHTARAIKDCQIAFSEVMHAIGNTATLHQKQEIGPAIAPSERYSSELPTEIRSLLDRQMPITEFGMRWEPNFQGAHGGILCSIYRKSFR